MQCGLPSMENLNRDIQSINFEILCVIREMSRNDLTLAAERFGVSIEFARRIRRASTSELRNAATHPRMLFQPRSTVALDALSTTFLSGKTLDEDTSERMRMTTLLARQGEGYGA